MVAAVRKRAVSVLMSPPKAPSSASLSTTLLWSWIMTPWNCDTILFSSLRLSPRIGVPSSSRNGSDFVPDAASAFPGVRPTRSFRP